MRGFIILGLMALAVFACLMLFVALEVASPTEPGDQMENRDGYVPDNPLLDEPNPAQWFIVFLFVFVMIGLGTCLIMLSIDEAAESDRNPPLPCGRLRPQDLEVTARLFQTRRRNPPLQGRYPRPQKMQVTGSVLQTRRRDYSARTYREWTRATDEYTVEAAFESLSFRTVKLIRKDNGKTIELPLEKLSDRDRKWILRFLYDSSPSRT